MEPNAYLLVSAVDEASAIDNVWNGTDWVPIATDLASALVFPYNTVTIEEMRTTQGDFQQRFSDRDVRQANAAVSITIV